MPFNLLDKARGVDLVGEITRQILSTNNKTVSMTQLKALVSKSLDYNIRKTDIYDNVIKKTMEEVGLG